MRSEERGTRRWQCWWGCILPGRRLLGRERLRAEEGRTAALGSLTAAVSEEVAAFVLSEAADRQGKP